MLEVMLYYMLLQRFENGGSNTGGLINSNSLAGLLGGAGGNNVFRPNTGNNGLQGANGLNLGLLGNGESLGLQGNGLQAELLRGLLSPQPKNEPELALPISPTLRDRRQGHQGLQRRPLMKRFNKLGRPAHKRPPTNQNRRKLPQQEENMLKALNDQELLNLLANNLAPIKVNPPAAFRQKNVKPTQANVSNE